MKNNFQSKAVPRGTRTIWRYLGALFILFTFAVGNVWGAYDVPADGTVTLSQKVNNGGRFNVEASGVYHFRTSSGYSWDSSNGIKTQSNAGGVVFYLDASKEIEVGIVHTEAKNAHEVTVHVYSITESVYKQFDDNKAGAAESNRTFSTAPTSSTDGSFTISITAESKTFTGKKTLAAGYYAVVPVGEKSKTFFKTIKFTAAAKTNPTITFNNGAYSVGSAALDLSSLFSSNSDGAVTYSVKTDGSTNASISGTNFTATAAGTAVVTASQAATSTYNAATKDANIVVTVPSTPTHDISYTNLKGSDVSGYPTTYYEGTGVASFDPLADVADFHFNGWSPASIAADATTDQTISATWVAAYNVTFNAGVGSGTVPASFQKWEGGKFNLPGQGSMTHATKVFDGWKANGAGDKLAADAEYTMGNADVEFVAQWKAAPVTIFHWKSNTGTITLDAANGTTTGGTTTLRTADPGKSWGNESVTYNASVASDMKGETSGKELKPGGNANYLELTLTSGTFQEGDVIYVTGYNNWAFLTSAEGINSATSFDVANVETGSGKGDAVTGSAIIPAGVEAATIYARRANGSSSGIAAIKVTRIVKDIISTVNTLTDVKVGESSISAANLATLVSEHSLALSDALASAPTITFNQHTVITYEDYSTKTSDTPIPVVASDNGAGKWTASATIDAVTYTVTLNIASGHSVIYDANGGSGTMTDANLYAEGQEVTVLANAFTAPAANQKFNGWSSSPSVTISEGKFNMPASDVTLSAQWKEFFTITYMDGAATLGTEEVFVGDAPVGLSPAPTKPLFSFAGWKDELDADVDVTTLTAAATVYAKWNKAYASSVDLEGLVEAEGTGADWQAYMSSHNFNFSTSGVSLDAKASGKTYNNWPYQGLKMKKTGSYVQGTVEAGKLVVIKLGHMAADATVTIGGVAQEDATGLDAAEPAGKYNYYYVASESVMRYETNNDGACVLKAITITDPYTVSFAAHGDADPAALDGHPAVTLPTPTNGTASFLGWFTAETGGTKIGDAGESYTPSADITLHAQWEAISTDARLSAIEITPNTGVLSPAFNMELTEYTYTMPYGSALPTVIGATANHEGATWYIESEAAAWGETTVVRGKALSNDTKAYNITMVQAPKDGVSIIKVATTGGTNKTVTGLYAGDGDVSLSSSTKMDNGKYIGFILDGTTLQAGDRINVHTTAAANTGGSHIIFYDNMTDKSELYETGEIGGLGDNIFTINAAMVGATTAYVYRSNADNAHKWNGYVDYIEVTRAMNPVLTAITIDGRDGEIDPLNETHFSVTIPYEAVLSSLTVVPTIIRNAAHATTPEAVISNEGAWVLGDNTYRVMDKDGDYTDYTITLTRDVLKHTVSFNAEGGSAVASELVVDGEHLTAAPAAPSREDYEFQGWAETTGGAVVDVTSFAITDDKEFHAIWLYENPIKLIKDNGELNTDDFITGATMASSPVVVETVSYAYAKLGNTASNVTGVNALNKFIAYNATTTRTRVMVDVYNNATSARNVYIKGVVEGTTDVDDLANVALDNGSNKHVKTLYYEYNNAANRTIYISVPSSVSDVYFLQVKVIESGDALPMFGESGYSINLNKGRLFGPSTTNLPFEGMTYKLSSNYGALNTESATFGKNASYSFSVSAPVTMTITTSNVQFYVDQTTTGTANSTKAEGAHSFDLTAGTWYINVAGSNLGVTKIEFTDPRPVHTRTGLNPNNIGTLCWKTDGYLVGGTLYELNGKNEYNKLVFDEVENNIIEEGKPYIFKPEGGNTEIQVFKTAESTSNTPLENVNGMQGTYVDLSSEDGTTLWGNYVISNNKYIYVDYTNVRLKAYRAYVLSLNDIPAASTDPQPTQNGAPRRRLVMDGNQAPAVVTGFDNLNAGEQPVKVMIDGKLFILRGEKMFDATGRLVK